MFAVTDSQVFGWGLNKLDPTDTLVYYCSQCPDHVTVPVTNVLWWGTPHTIVL